MIISYSIFLRSWYGVYIIIAILVYYYSLHIISYNLKDTCHVLSLCSQAAFVSGAFSRSVGVITDTWTEATKCHSTNNKRFELSATHTTHGPLYYLLFSRGCKISSIIQKAFRTSTCAPSLTI